jgi:putative ABC transport system substrate-binding protein
MRATRRRLLLASLGFLAAAQADGASGASSPPTRRLGILWLPREGDREVLKQLLKTLAALGHVEGRNLVIEMRSCKPADAAECAARAAELVELRVDAILTDGTTLAGFAQRATRTIPIVGYVGDPVASGFAKSLARPGGNMTGITDSLPEQCRKQIELLRRIAPKTTMVGVLHADGWTRENHAVLMATIEGAGRDMGMPVRFFPAAAGDAAAFERVMKEIGRAGGAASLLYYNQAVPDWSAIAIRHRVPTVGYVRDGGLMGYALGGGPKDRERMARILDKVLRGMSPAEIPFELATHSFFAVNRRTAAALGLTLGSDVLTLADEVLD